MPACICYTYKPAGICKKKNIFEFKKKKNEEDGTWAKTPTPKEAEFINEQMNEHVFKYRNERIDKGEKNG